MMNRLFEVTGGDVTFWGNVDASAGSDELTCNLTTHYSATLIAALPPKSRVTNDGDTFEVQRAYDPDGRRRELAIVATRWTEYDDAHSESLAEATAEGLAVVFTKVRHAHAPLTGELTPIPTTVAGRAVRVDGDPKKYAELSLSEDEAVTLEFTPATYGQTPPLGATVELWALKYIVRAVDPIAPNGVVIRARVVVSR